VADLALLGADPAVIADAIQLARATSAIIRVNLAWAFGVNAIAIPLAALGYLGPLSAGIVGAASSVIVVANSLLLRGYRPGRRRR
jgi:Cu+-exporting ATPase